MSERGEAGGEVEATGRWLDGKDSPDTTRVDGPITASKAGQGASEDLPEAIGGTGLRGQGPC